jgi:uncharacterized protein YjbJ (UPF0337 family)
MLWQDIEKNWQSLTPRARHIWTELTEDDLSRIAGDQSQLIGRIQQRYAIARAEAERQVEEWTASEFGAV